MTAADPALLPLSVFSAFAGARPAVADDFDTGHRNVWVSDVNLDLAGWADDVNLLPRCGEWG
ncbi:hypothetical protein [Streptomyces sp. NPDC088358]|uniref:hypothetical protein n=1 Tax=Streptomyces sp. NPDC088358 TaxID=3365857 RepID=UPI003823E64C